jgi:CRISPR-associated endoribonuclease Cas6
LRIEIQLQPSRLPFSLPASYSYLLTSLIYRTLERSSSEYSTFLHERGYGSERPFKLFTFSPLLLPNRAFHYEKEQLWIDARRLRWQISSPMREFVEHLAQGLLSQGEIELGREDERWALGIEEVRVLEPPVFRREMVFKCLAPLVLTTGSERAGRFGAHYLRHDEAGWSERMRANLVRKFELVHARTLEETDFAMEFDRAYIERRSERAYKLIDFKGTKIKGVFVPFRAMGSPELIQIGYEAGFGEKNSMGFGMAEPVESTHNFT